MTGERFYKKHDPEGESLYPYQKLRLEMGKFVDQVCRKHGIKYTLMFETLTGALQRGGFYPNIYSIEMAMMYHDRLRFKEVFQEEVRETGYYLLDDTNFEQFEDDILLLVKNEGVELPTERKEDEMYYGYGIVISPVYYAGNTAEEYEAFVEKAEELKRRVNVRSYSPSFLTPKSKRKNRKYWEDRDKLLEERTPQDYENLKKHLTQYGDRPTRYVYASRVWKSDEDVLKKAETYQEVEEVLFEGYSFYAMKNGREWVDAVYGKKGIERMEKARFQLFYAYGLNVLRQVQLIQLEMLKELDRICRKHGIRYYISFGTLLGAVRHGGFIPWDDDADVVMMWEDYCKFCEVVEKELEHEKFFFRTPYTDKNCNIAISRLHRNGARMSFLSRENIDTHTGIPLDIFPMFPGNRLRIAECIRDRLCRFFKTMLWTHLGAAEEKRRLHRWYYKLLSKVSNRKAYELFLKTGNMRTKETDNLMFPYVLHQFYPQGEGVTSKKNYGTPVNIEFEGYLLMAPANAMEILSKTYGSDCLRLPPYGARVVPHSKIEFLDLREVEPL